MGAETVIVKQVQVEASDLGARLFRNNCGKLPDRTGRWVEFGLQPGSGDLIGWVPTVITADMVGKTFARFLSVECKTMKGRLQENQKSWRETVNRNGGLAGVARNKEELSAILKS